MTALVFPVKSNVPAGTLVNELKWKEMSSRLGDEVVRPAGSKEILFEFK
jgi:hypothetical protein